MCHAAKLSMVRCCLVALAVTITTGIVAEGADKSKPGLIALDVVIVELSGKVQAGKLQQGDATGDEISKRIAELEKQGKLTSISRFHLSTLENQKALIQIGERVPVTTGVQRFSSRASGGNTGRSVSYQDTGSIVSATARIESDDRIVVELNIEQSRLKKSDLAPEGGDKKVAVFDPPKTSTLTVQSTVILRNGKAMLLGGRRRFVGASGSHTMILVSGRILQASSSAKAEGAAGKPQQLRIFHLKNTAVKEVSLLVKKLIPSGNYIAEADERSNTLLVKATKDHMSAIETLINELDRSKK